MRRSFYVGAVFSLVALVGCGSTKLKKTPDAALLCEPPQKLNSVGLCVDCTSNADCPDGQQCNLITGTCAPIPPPPPDGGQALTCQPGARRCATDGHSVQECAAEDGGTSSWNDVQACTAGQTCAEVPGYGPECTVCIPGETLCDSSDQSSTYTRCKNDGTGWEAQDCNANNSGFTCHQVVTHSDPSDGGAPVAALATCRLCDPGSATPVNLADGGNGILYCDSTGTTQTFSSCYPTNRFATYPDGGMVQPPYCELPVCYPGDHKCSAPNASPGRQSCNADGTGWVQDDCPSGDVCGPTPTDRGACLSPCDVAENSASYVGCDYWGSLLSNTGLDPSFATDANGQSEYSMVVGNTSSTLTAHVSVTSLGGGGGPFTATVGPNSTASIHLPWKQLCGTGQAKLGYHLTSDAPVTVYQFNPLNSAIPNSTSCTQNSDCDSFPFAGDGVCRNNKCQTFAYSDDASLLLPTHLLGTSYVVVSEDHESNIQSGSEFPLPGSFSVVASADNTRVRIHFAGAALASGTQPGANSPCTNSAQNIAAVSAGQTVDYTMGAGDVLQFWTSSTGQKTCTNAASGIQNCLWSNDLTGTVVTSLPGSDGRTKKVAVFGGADCTFKPYGVYACDHIEEEMFPFNTWGKKYVGVKSHTYAGATATYPDFWRIVAGCGPNSCPNGTTVTITPAVSAARAASSCGSACTCTTSGGATTCHLPPLGSGQTAPWIEFQHNSSFVADSDQPAVLAQYFVGENEAGQDSSGMATATEGDPSLVLAPPVEQWRGDYTILAPTTYVHNFLNLMVQSASATSQVQVDGTTVPASEWAQIPGTQFYAAVHPLSNANANHSIKGNNGVKVGVVVYGYDSYVSYGYTGGLDLQSITQINPGG